MIIHGVPLPAPPAPAAGHTPGSAEELSHGFGADGWERADAETLGEFANFPVATIGDAMERLGLCDSGIQPVWRGAKLVGTALTVLCRAGDNRAAILAVGLAKPGDVLVVNGFGATDRALLGDQLARRLQRRGVVGAVIDGAVRDRGSLESLSYPVFARGVNPAGPFKYGPGTIGEPVAVGGVVCMPGDIVVADDDGVAVIPRVRATEVLERTVVAARTERMMAENLDFMPLSSARNGSER